MKTKVVKFTPAEMRLLSKAITEAATVVYELTEGQALLVSVEDAWDLLAKKRKPKKGKGKK